MSTKFSRLWIANMSNGSIFNKKYFAAFWIGHLVALMILAGTEAQKKDLAEPVGRFRGSSGRFFNFNFANICSESSCERDLIFLMLLWVLLRI